MSVMATNRTLLNTTAFIGTDALRRVQLYSTSDFAYYQQLSSCEIR